jgi:hypothetical protein
MEARQVHRIEHAIDVAAAAVFASAAITAALRFGFVVAFAAGLAAFCVLLGLLRAVDVEEPGFALQAFEPAILPAAAETEELLLTDVDRLEPGQAGEDELILEDVLAELSDDSRVVRLFDPAAMPDAGELKARIDRHLDKSVEMPAPDASKALHEALFELRKSLR